MDTGDSVLTHESAVGALEDAIGGPNEGRIRAAEMRKHIEKSIGKGVELWNLLTEDPNIGAEIIDHMIWVIEGLTTTLQLAEEVYGLLNSPAPHENQ